MMNKRSSLNDKGVSLPLVALSITVLIGLAAMATDLGWMYTNASRVQRAADAAALAGVIHMPQDFSGASATAESIGQTNMSYLTGLWSDPVDYIPPSISTASGASASELSVTVSAEIPTFFLRVFGMDTMTITRTATADYLPPLRLGSPGNQFGNSCKPGVTYSDGTKCTGQSNFWANIHGPYTAASYGDAFTSYCASQDGTASCTANPNHRDTGYLYGIERGSNPGFQVYFNDIVHHNNSGTTNTGDHVRTGDRGCEAWGSKYSPREACGQRVRVTLYEPDPTPLDVSDATAICSVVVEPEAQVPENTPYEWETLSSCFNVAAAGEGVYVLQIQAITGDPAGQSGLNRYGLKVSNGSKLYAINDFSLSNNVTSTTSSFYLAEVLSIYKGKKLAIEVYDAAETANGILTIVGPGGIPWDDGCRIYNTPGQTKNWDYLTTKPEGTTCSHMPGTANGRWIKFEIDIPADYECTDCWWSIAYGGDSTNDTTTWSARIIGNPIHLVPGGGS